MNLIEISEPREDSFSRNHPELLPGESFLSNVRMERIAAIEAGDDEFYSQYEGVRVGTTAYDNLGRHRPNDRPVFHQGFRKSQKNA